jgi:4-amino-4-deoxy-L-arabinose transferase-like glycosyltransferase
LVAGLWFTRRAARTATARAALLLWGGWLLVTAAVFSFMGGIVHPYYTVALAPAITALVGISASTLWQRRQFAVPRLLLATMSAVTGGWAFILLNRTPDWVPALRWVALAGSVVVAVTLAAGAQRLGRIGVSVLAAAAMLFGVLGPAAFAIETVAHSHSAGPMAVAGPMSDDMPKGFGGHRAFGADADNVALQHLIERTDNRWAAAAVGSMGVSGLELATKASIMAIGGFTGSDNSPTLDQFQGYVAQRQVRYFIDERRDDKNGPPRRMESGSAHDITTWVRQHFTPIDVSGTTVYDLAAPVAP